MKKIFILVVLAISYLTSCNKQYICTCTINGTVKYENYIIYNSKRKALKNCNKSTNSERTCVLEAY